ncbi:MAG: hypothetical protein MJ072_04250, partial [Clostridia bacterium]|nr:hypothetical protein [Clostridia bacterium]
MENFIYEYWDQKEACADVLEELGYGLTTEEMLRELSSRVAEENEDSDQTGKISSDAFMYLATYEVLKQYRFIDRNYFESWDDYGDTFFVTNLADYMELIANTAFDDEETAEALACAFLSGMSKTDIYLMKTVGIPLYTMDGTISPLDTDKLETQYFESKEVLIEGYAACGFEENECTIWFGTNKEYLETDSLAMTSASIRREKADEEFKDSLTKAQEDKLYKEQLSDKLEYVGIACAVVGVVMSVAFLVVAKLGLSVSLGSILSMGMFSIMGCGSTFGLGMAGMIATAVGFLTFAIMLILLVCMILLIFLLLFKPEKKKDEEKVERTPIPKIMVDCEEGANNSIAKMVRYDVATDIYGDAMDLNSDGTGDFGKYDVWNALYYTKDQDFGSPLTANSTEEYFNVTYDNGEGPSLSVSASAFGYTPSYDLNTGSDSDYSVYLHYYTYNSINEIVEKG